MKIRGGQEKEGVKLDMTSMIDIVFQLLVFFVMTFKITALEGDFNINMPMASEIADPIDSPLDSLISVYLQETPEHGLQGIQVTYQGNVQTYTHDPTDPSRSAYVALRQQIRSLVEQGNDPSIASELEVEFEVDGQLAYGETIKAIEHVSARIENRQIIPLIENIKFKDAPR